MRKTYISLLVIGLAAVLVGAGSFAYFSDTESSVGNTFAAGTLDLEVRNGAGVWINGSNVDLGWSAACNNLKPGDYRGFDVPVRNVGSVSGVPSFKFDITTNSPGTNPEPEGAPDAANLADAIHVDFLCLHGDGTSCFLYTGPLSGLDDNVIYAHQSLGAGAESENWSLYFNVPPTVGNEIMGDYVDFNVDFGLMQDEAL